MKHRSSLMDQSRTMLFGRNTYEFIEGHWSAVARYETAPRQWTQKLEATSKYLVANSRGFLWQNTITVAGGLGEVRR